MRFTKKRSYFYMLVLIVVVFLLYPHTAFSKIEKKKVTASALTNKLSLNLFAITAKDLIPVKKSKEVFTFDDKKIIWSGSIRGGWGKYNKKDYQVFWYSPDGHVFQEQTAKYILMDCSGLKSKLKIDEESMRNKVGIWKVEIVYENQIIDEKYFYFGDEQDREITIQEKEHLDSLLVRKTTVSDTKDGAEEIRRRELSDRIIVEEINLKYKDDIENIVLKTSSSEKELITTHNNKDFVEDSVSKLSITYKFKPLWGTFNKELYHYYLSPENKIIQENETHFIFNDTVTFKMKNENIDKIITGEWKSVLYLKDAKIAEYTFNVVAQKDYQEIIGDIREEEQELRDKEREEQPKGVQIPISTFSPDAILKGVPQSDREEYISRFQIEDPGLFVVDSKIEGEVKNVGVFILGTSHMLIGKLNMISRYLKSSPKSTSKNLGRVRLKPLEDYNVINDILSLGNKTVLVADDGYRKLPPKEQYFIPIDNHLNNIYSNLKSSLNRQGYNTILLNSYSDFRDYNDKKLRDIMDEIKTKFPELDAVMFCFYANSGFRMTHPSYGIRREEKGLFLYLNMIMFDTADKKVLMETNIVVTAKDIPEDKTKVKKGSFFGLTTSDRKITYNQRDLLRIFHGRLNWLISDIMPKKI